MSPVAETVNAPELNRKLAAEFGKISQHELNNNEHVLRARGERYSANTFHAINSQPQMVIIAVHSVLAIIPNLTVNFDRFPFSFQILKCLLK